MMRSGHSPAHWLAARRTMHRWYRDRHRVLWNAAAAGGRVCSDRRHDERGRAADAAGRARHDGVHSSSPQAAPLADLRPRPSTGEGRDAPVPIVEVVASRRAPRADAGLTWTSGGRERPVSSNSSTERVAERERSWSSAAKPASASRACADNVPLSMRWFGVHVTAIAMDPAGHTNGDPSHDRCSVRGRRCARPRGPGGDRCRSPGAHRAATGRDEPHRDDRDAASMETRAELTTTLVDIVSARASEATADLVRRRSVDGRPIEGPFIAVARSIGRGRSSPRHVPDGDGFPLRPRMVVGGRAVRPDGAPSIGRRGDVRAADRERAPALRTRRRTPAQARSLVRGPSARQPLLPRAVVERV